MKTCLILLSCLVYEEATLTTKKEFKPCAIEVSRVKKVLMPEASSVFIEDFGEVKESVSEIVSKINDCKKM
jgi:hypothetical protein